MGIKYEILSQNEDECSTQLEKAEKYMKETNEVFALIVQKGAFSDYTLQNKMKNAFSLSREEAIQIVTSSIEEDAVIVSTTGMISRELFEYRESVKQGHERDFLTVGSMGHASQIALGIALQQKQRKVYCFDGDGATLMHMGSMAITASMLPTNYIHIIFNNGAHDSVGGQPTVGLQINLPKIAEACGYQKAMSALNIDELKQKIEIIKTMRGPILLEIKVKKGARKDLGRPTTTPIQNKDALMSFLNQ